MTSIFPSSIFTSIVLAPLSLEWTKSVNAAALEEYYYILDPDWKNYELSNHLGNVLAVVSDRKDAVPSGNTADPVASYIPTIISANDYFPFGLQVEGRSYIFDSNAKGHRYGFNGKEKDTDGEWGTTAHYDYGFRIYNPAIAKFLSVDPLSNDFPFYTPYQFAGNKPIVAIDLDGLEEKIVIYQYDYLDNKLVVINEVTLYRNAEDGPQQINGYSFDQYDKIEEYGPFGTLTVYQNLNIDNTVEVYEETWRQWYNNLTEKSPMQNVKSGFGFTVSDDFALIGQGKETKEAENTTNVNLDIWFENKTLSGASGVSKVNDKLAKSSANIFWETGNFIPSMTVGAAEGVNRLGATKTATNSTLKIVTEVKKKITGYNQDSTRTHTIEEGSEALKLDDYNYEN